MTRLGFTPASPFFIYARSVHGARTSKTRSLMSKDREDPISQIERIAFLVEQLDKAGMTAERKREGQGVSSSRAFCQDGES